MFPLAQSVSQDENNGGADECNRVEPMQTSSTRIPADLLATFRTSCGHQVVPISVLMQHFDSWLPNVVAVFQTGWTWTVKASGTQPCCPANPGSVLGQSVPALLSLNGATSLQPPRLDCPVTQYILERRRKSARRCEIEAAKKVKLSASRMCTTDARYVERRAKNNEAAKRSRNLKRRKEEEVAMRAALLEEENVRLKAQLAMMKNEMTKLHWLLLKSPSNT